MFIGFLRGFKFIKIKTSHKMSSLKNAYRSYVSTLIFKHIKNGTRSNSIYWCNT